jgi:hypothetical protein
VDFAGAKQAAEKGRQFGENLEKHTAGAKARVDLIGFMPGINPRPTARTSFSAACLAQLLLLALSASAAAESRALLQSLL